MSSSRTASVVKMTNARFEELTVKPGTMGANTPCNLKELYVNDQAVGHATQVFYKKNLPPQIREIVGSLGIDDESYRSRSWSVQRRTPLLEAALSLSLRGRHRARAR